MDFTEFKWKYLLSMVISKMLPQKPPPNRVIFITEEGTKGWILDAKAKRLSANFHGDSDVLYSETFKKIPDAKGYFFLHFKYFLKAIRYNPRILHRKCVVMFTHPNWNKHYTIKHVIYILNKANFVVCLNSAIKDELISFGLESDKIKVFHMASNTQFFSPKIRDGKGAVGFCMAYYPRKNPDLMLEIVKGMPHRNFILVGRHWEQYPSFQELISLPNFTYYDNIPYEEYPALYHKMDVFVSTSHNEGGPVPILEAMLSNVVPVASRTGFCPDLIENGVNGFLFNSNTGAYEVIQLIEKAFAFQINVREKAEPHSWERYGKLVSELFM